MRNHLAGPPGNRAALVFYGGIPRQQACPEARPPSSVGGRAFSLGEGECFGDRRRLEPSAGPEARFARVPGAMPKALELALNRTGQGMAALTSQGVRAQYTTKASARRGVYEVRTDPRREGYQRLSLMHFAGVRLREMPGAGKARPPKGIRVRVRKDRGGYLPHSFVAPMRNSRTGGDTGLGIFQRQGKARTPIREMTSASVASQMKNTGVRERVVPEAQRRLDARHPLWGRPVDAAKWRLATWPKIFSNYSWFPRRFAIAGLARFPAGLAPALARHHHHYAPLAGIEAATRETRVHFHPGPALEPAAQVIKLPQSHAGGQPAQLVQAQLFQAMLHPAAADALAEVPPAAGRRLGGIRMGMGQLQDQEPPGPQHP